MSKPTFLLGVGCQKAGTSWLHDYLARNSRVRLSQPKELHVLDAMLRPDLFLNFYWGDMAQLNGQGLHEKLGRAVVNNKGYKATAKMRLEMMAKPQAYIDYFKTLSEGVSVVGEITPSYAAFSAEDYSFIRDLLEPHFDLKIVALLRDPVKRAFSAVRHFRNINGEKFPVAFRGDDNWLFERLYQSPYIAARADYPSWLDNLDQAFRPGQVYIGFYETLFTEATVTEICAFLGVAPHPADFGRRVNDGSKPSVLDSALAQRARQAYAPIYDYCAKRFGAEKMAGIWTYPEWKAEQGGKVLAQ